MSWRTVVVSEPAKLELKLGYLVVRGETISRISLSEINILIIESTAAAITTSLLCELSKRKIKVVFCDEKHNPYAELINYYGSADTLRRLDEQLEWSDEISTKIWTLIVKDKIRQQARLLKELNHNREAEQLIQYLSEVQQGDHSNREAHAAKVYFNAIFGSGFSRKDETAINAALNYGYSILLSSFNKDIVSRGYLTQLGLHHKSTFNPFNFSSDLMEPFRPLVDHHVVNLSFNNFAKTEKHKMLELLNTTVEINGSQQNLVQAINVFCSSVFRALNSNNPDLITFYTCQGS